MWRGVVGGEGGGEVPGSARFGGIRFPRRSSRVCTKTPLFSNIYQKVVLEFSFIVRTVMFYFSFLKICYRIVVVLTLY